MTASLQVMPHVVDCDVLFVAAGIIASRLCCCSCCTGPFSFWAVICSLWSFIALILSLDIENLVVILDVRSFWLTIVVIPITRSEPIINPAWSILSWLCGLQLSTVFSLIRTIMLFVVPLSVDCDVSLPGSWRWNGLLSVFCYWVIHITSRSLIPPLYIVSRTAFLVIILLVIVVDLRRGWILCTSMWVVTTFLKLVCSAALLKVLLQHGTVSSPIVSGS